MQSLGAFFTSGLEEIARRRNTISAVRVRGLLLAAVLNVEAAPIVEAALERGYLINAVQKQVLRFAPPFIITEEEIASSPRESTTKCDLPNAQQDSWSKAVVPRSCSHLVRSALLSLWSRRNV